MNLSTNKYKLPELHIGNKTARIPIIQGGMGVGVSLSGLAGAVAKEGGVGIISTAQIGYDDDAFDEDRETLLAQLKAAGIERVVNVGASIHSSHTTLELIEKHDFLYGAIGVHPSETEELNEEWMNWLEEKSHEKKVVAIGEIGLDYHWEEPARDVQKYWFVRQLDLARKVKLPVIIHSRDAAADTMEIMKEHGRDLGGVIHCFSYGPEMAREYLKMGYYLGIGGVVTFTNAKKLKEVVKETPIDRIVLETDCPYLSPVPNRGKRNSSLNLPYVVEEISRIKDVPAEQIIEITNRNAKQMYRLSL